MKRICLIALVVGIHTSFLQATETEFEFTFGSKIGNIPMEISKKSKDIKTMGGININSWFLSPNYSSFVSKKKSSNFSADKIFKDRIYIKFNLRF
jgi:hypothetical protein